MAIGLGMGTLLGGLAAGGASVYGARKQNQATTTATGLSVGASNRAAELEAEAAARSLAFLKENEERRRLEWERTQAQNLDIWRDERDYMRGLEAARQDRLRPYQNMGVGSLGQLAKPIPTLPGQGSLASILKG